MLGSQTLTVPQAKATSLGNFQDLPVQCPGGLRACMGTAKQWGFGQHIFPLECENEKRNSRKTTFVQLFCLSVSCP